MAASPPQPARRVRLKLALPEIEPIARALAGADPAQALRALAAPRSLGASASPTSAPARALCSVLADLTSQGWRLSIRDQSLQFRAPRASAGDGEDNAAVKARVRSALEAARAEALAEAPTREFIRRMETRRVVALGRRLCVFDLVDDGAELSKRLEECAALPSQAADDRIAALIRPRVQPVVAEARCEHTGLPLLDIWRYFRLTWALPYRSTPGRTFPFLIRNDARPGGPVMGIGALASPVAQLSRRDDWIGWTISAVRRRLVEDPGWWGRVRDAMRRTVASAMTDIRTDDLLAIASRSAAPLEDALRALCRDAAAQRRRALQPERSPVNQDLAARADSEDALEVTVDPATRVPLTAAGAPDWAAAAEDVLFVRKRAGALADLVAAQRELERAPADASAAVDAFDRDEAFARAVRIALRELRKVGLASRVLDLSVCGAVAPYGPLLVGKLTALSVASRELRDAYRARYGAQVSVIASQMAGREIRRPADYCALTTTSLYGVASSQYNRLAVDAGGTSLRWRDLGQSVGFGTVHLSRATLAALTEAVESKYGGRNVTYRFGEGNSPTLRQAREGLEIIVDEPNALLMHESPRRVYGLTIGSDARDALCLNENLHAAPPDFADVAAAWRRRWLYARASRVDVIRAVASMGPRTVQERLARVDSHDPQLGLF